MMNLSFGGVPDEVLIRVLSAHDARTSTRTISQRWHAVVDCHFAARHFPSPLGRQFNVDFEVDRFMSKDTYCARFVPASKEEQEAGAVEGVVEFLNWAPVYYRSAKNERRNVRHTLGEDDSCAFWRLIARLILSESENRSFNEVPSSSSSSSNCQADLQGHLVVTEGSDNAVGDTCSVRHVIGRLSATTTAAVLCILDHRKNAAAKPMGEAVATHCFS